MRQKPAPRTRPDSRKGWNAWTHGGRRNESSRLRHRQAQGTASPGQLSGTLVLG
jgi:hypothetical protein